MCCPMIQLQRFFSSHPHLQARFLVHQSTRIADFDSLECINNVNPLTLKSREPTIAFWVLPKIRVLHIAEICRFAPPCTVGIDETL